MNRFYTCLVISIIIHIAVLVPLQLMARYGIITPHQVIKVSLVGSPTVKGPDKIENTTQPDFDISYEKENPLLEKPEKANYSDDQPDKINEVLVDDPSNIANLSYYGKVKGKILINYKYPQEAADAGIHGYVQVTFIIDSSGKVSSLKVTKSSGYKILDSVSTKAVLDASPFPPRENSIKMEIGFLYILDN
jgi:TonB family protein